MVKTSLMEIRGIVKQDMSEPLNKINNVLRVEEWAISNESVLPEQMARRKSGDRVTGVDRWDT